MRGSWTPGPPHPAQRAERVPTWVLLRPDDDSVCFGPLPRSCHDRHPEWGLSNIRQTRRMGVKVRSDPRGQVSAGLSQRRDAVKSRVVV